MKGCSPGYWGFDPWSHQCLEDYLLVASMSSANGLTFSGFVLFTPFETPKNSGSHLCTPKNFPGKSSLTGRTSKDLHALKRYVNMLTIFFLWWEKKNFPSVIIVKFIENSRYPQDPSSLGFCSSPSFKFLLFLSFFLLTKLKPSTKIKKQPKVPREKMRTH